MTRLRARKSATLAERLALHSVVAPSGCWVWLGARSDAGYGRVQVDGKCKYAHRVSYELRVGPIPAGMELDHLCRYRACIRPLHLQAVTPRINFQRGYSPSAMGARRATCRYGHARSEHAYAHRGRRHCRVCQKAYHSVYRSLSAEQIMARRSLGLPVVDLAGHFAAASVSA